MNIQSVEREKDQNINSYGSLKKNKVEHDYGPPFT